MHTPSHVNVCVNCTLDINCYDKYHKYANSLYNQERIFLLKRYRWFIESCVRQLETPPQSFRPVIEGCEEENDLEQCEEK